MESGLEERDDAEEIGLIWLRGRSELYVEAQFFSCIFKYIRVTVMSLDRTSFNGIKMLSFFLLSLPIGWTMERPIIELAGRGHLLGAGYWSPLHKTYLCGFGKRKPPQPTNDV